MIADKNIEFYEQQNGQGFIANCHGKQVGEINIFFIGVDRLVIESTYVSDEYKNTNLCLDLVSRVVAFARETHRKIISMCPMAQSIFNGHPEFDDVRFIRFEI
ncbi:MAG: N-acetyltransferase [Alphaproteobacteria bacterium]|nr:N-acetyltransferase [Alphaproteobacteria bacterium]